VSGAVRPKTGGRKRGTPNRVTSAVKDAILRAFEKVGGEDYLVTVAKSDPRTLCALLSRVLPSELRADVGVSLSHEEALAELEARITAS